MAKSRKTPTSKPKTTFGPYRGKSRPITAFFFLVMGGLLLVSLILFDLDQSPLKKVSFEPASEGGGGEFLVGVFGEYVAFGTLSMLGISAWVIVLLCFWLGYINLFRRSHLLKWPQIVSIFVYTLSISIFGTLSQELFSQDLTEKIHNDWSFAKGLGGTVGNLFYMKGLKIWLGPVGTLIVNGSAMLISLMVLFTSDPSNLFERISQRYGNHRQAVRDKRQQRRKEKERLKKERLEAKQLAKAAAEKSKAEDRSNSRQFRLRQKEDEANTLEPITPAAVETVQPAKKAKRMALNLLGRTQVGKEEKSVPLKIVASEATRKARKKTVPSKRGSYIFPNLGLLEDPPKKDQGLDKSEHERTASALIQTLANFNVTVAMGEVHTGPVITRYEVLPAPGVKVGKILGLSNDIALGLKALAVRIQAPVPGKGTVGIEVPNKRPELVYLRDIIESEDWASSRAEIPIALGKEVSGRPLIADLTKMPHLLVAGATGSGKTVCINSIVASLLYHSSPEDLRFIMVDPKIVEMQVYNDLPHMLIPVVTEPKKVPGALKWLIAEMERRYQVFAEMGVRNIAGFNDKQKAKLKKKKELAAQSALDNLNNLEDPLGMENIPDPQAPDVEVPRDVDIEIPDKFPYIVCIIDELADLMMVAQQDIETAIARLAQLARAAGIHLIIATQRPSVNVITGIIKANLPSRIAFQVSSKVDSRTILDEGGADQLIGRGDMLFNPPGSGKLVRSQGCFVSDDEINNIVEFLKQNGPPQFAEEVQRQLESNEDDIDWLQNDGDKLFPDALEVLRSTRRASTSMLQRRLKIGYNRAARIMELMEARGIVGPENGPQPREILVDLENF